MRDAELLDWIYLVILLLIRVIKWGTHWRKLVGVIVDCLGLVIVLRRGLIHLLSLVVRAPSERVNGQGIILLLLLHNSDISEDRRILFYIILWS
jgi:hypothetical protein